MQRTPQECEIRWLGDRHPSFNHSEWSKAEIEKVQELIGDAKEGEVDWVDVAAKLGVRVISTCTRCPFAILHTHVVDPADKPHPG